MRKVVLLVTAVCLITLPSVLCANTVVEEIVARVNNAIITLSDYQHSRDELKQELEHSDPANADKLFAEQQKDVLRDLIDRQLLLQRGADLGISADVDVIKRLDEMRKEMHLDSMEALQKAAEAQGVSFEDFKQNLKDQIITQKVISREVGQKLNIDKEDEQKYYDEHKQELAQPEAIRLSELLIATSPDADNQQLLAAQNQAKDLLAQIRKGADFAELAKKYSSGPSAAQGGDLGYFKRGILAKQLEDTTFAMKAGQVTNVIRTKQGFVILKVTEHQGGGIPPLKEVEPQIQEAVYMHELQPALRAYLEKLRVDAYIDIKPGYVDTAASPNETKPIETTTKEASAKDLKKKKKFGIF
jgi:peptidyl-prolyl cis-trans isomerase SurA